MPRMCRGNDRAAAAGAAGPAAGHRAGRSGLVAGAPPTGIVEPGDQSAHRRLVMDKLLHLGRVLPHGNTATEIESLCTSNPRWIGPGCVALLMAAGSFRLWLRPLKGG